MKIINICFILVSVLTCNSMIMVAQDITPPERPMITHVTVDTTTGNTIIYWDESSSEDVRWYYIYYEVMTVNGLEGVKLDSLPSGNSSYNHEGNARNESMIYSISAIDSAGNESVRTPGFHSTVFTSIHYDSCYNAIEVQWTPYSGWGENISGYRVYSRQEDEDYGSPLGVSKNDTSIRFENIRQNTHYYFFVEALKNDTLTSLSNIAGKYTYFPGPPDSFNLMSVNVVSDNSVRIDFEFTDTSSVNDFRLLRSIDKSADFISVDSKYDLNSGESFFIDSIITGTQKYYYKIGAINSCNRVFSETNVGTNILLEGSNIDNRNELKWNFYESWEPGVSGYEVIMYGRNAEPQILSSTNPNVSNFSHNLTEIYGTGFDGVISYRVIARKTGEDISSQSNIVRVDLPGKMSVPNAFTPNNDGINDIFKPFFTLLPQKFMMVIYDRHGIVVYKTENPEEGWQGQIHGGGMAMEGVYVYHIQYTGHTGKTVEKTGHVTVFYP